MANSAQARKRARQAVKQRAHNASLRSTLRTAVKRVQKAIVAGDKAAAQSIYTESVSIIDRIADKKIVHKNKASRHKSRLSAQIKALAAWLSKCFERNGVFGRRFYLRFVLSALVETTHSVAEIILVLKK